MVTKPDTCPCCGSVLPIHKTFPNSRVKQAIFDYIRTHPGCSREEIVRAVWADDPNGGPESSSIISVHLKPMRQTLASYGLVIQVGRGRDCSGYYVTSIESAQ